MVRLLLHGLIFHCFVSSELPFFLVLRNPWHYVSSPKRISFNSKEGEWRGSFSEAVPGVLPFLRQWLLGPLPT